MTSWGENAGASFKTFRQTWNDKVDFNLEKKIEEAADGKDTGSLMWAAAERRKLY